MYDIQSNICIHILTHTHLHIYKYIIYVYIRTYVHTHHTCILTYSCAFLDGERCVYVHARTCKKEGGGEREIFTSYVRSACMHIFVVCLCVLFLLPVVFSFFGVEIPTKSLFPYSPFHRSIKKTTTSKIKKSKQITMYV